MGRIKPPSGLIFRRASKPERAFPWKDAVQQENYNLTLDDTVKMLGATEMAYTSPLVRDMVGGIYKGAKWLVHDAWVDEEEDFKKAAAARAGAPSTEPSTVAPLEGTETSIAPLIQGIQQTIAEPAAALAPWQTLDIGTMDDRQIQEYLAKMTGAARKGYNFEGDELKFFQDLEAETKKRTATLPEGFITTPLPGPVAADPRAAMLESLGALDLTADRVNYKKVTDVQWLFGTNKRDNIEKGLKLGNEVLQAYDPIEVIREVVEPIVGAPPGPTAVAAPPAQPTPRLARPSFPTAEPRAAVPYKGWKSAGTGIFDRVQQIPGWTEEVGFYLDQLAQQPEFAAAIKQVPLEGRMAFLENLVTVINDQLAAAKGAPAAAAEPLDLTPFRIRPGASIGEAQALMAGLARAGGTAEDAAFIINYGVGNLSEDDLGEWLSSGRKGGAFRSPMAISQHLYKAYEEALVSRTKAGIEAEKSELRQAQLAKLYGRTPQAAATVRKTQAQADAAEAKNELNRILDPIKAGQAWATLERTLMTINTAAKPYINYNAKARTKPDTKPPETAALEAFRKAISSNTKSLKTFSRQYLKGHSGKLTALDAQLVQLNSNQQVDYSKLSDDEKIALFGGSIDRLRAAQKRANEDKATRIAEIKGLRKKRLALTAQKQKVSALVNDVTKLQKQINTAVLKTKSALTPTQREKLGTHLTELQETLAAKQYHLTEIMGQ